MTNKDVLYVEDFFNWNLNIYDTVSKLMDMATNDDLINVLDGLKGQCEKTMKKAKEVLH